MTSENEVDVTPLQDRGVLKNILKEGEGDEKPPKGCRVKVHYTGFFLDEKTFDSSRDRGTPFEFNLGQGEVIKAWDLGVASMKKGERAILTCASNYAYGAAGSPPSIPPDSVLKFDVEVLDWAGEDLSSNKDGSIQRFVITEGSGYSKPLEGSFLEVHLQGKYNGTVFEDRDVSFCLGEGEDVNVIEGVETALENFKKGEVSKLLIKSKHAYGASGNPNFNIPPNADVEYLVNLSKFQKEKEAWNLNETDKLEQAQLLKERGTSYIKREKYSLAIKCYKRGLAYFEESSETVENADIKAYLVATNLNLALCYLKLKEYFEVKNATTSVISLDKSNEKAYFRRGQALLALSEPKDALDDFTRVLELNSENRAAKDQVAQCRKIIKEQIEKEKKIYANMFDKFAKTDTQKEENELKKLPDVMSSLGEWGKEDRLREPSEFEKENPNILILNGGEEFKDM